MSRRTKATTPQAAPRDYTMAKSTLTSLRRVSKRPRHHIDQFASRQIAREIDVLVITLHRDDFIDIEPVPYPVKGLAKG